MDKIFQKRLKRKRKLEARVRTYGTKSLPYNLQPHVQAKAARKMGEAMLKRRQEFARKELTATVEKKKPWYKRLFNRRSS